MYGKNFLKSTTEDFCVNPITRYIMIIVSLAIAVATVVIAVLAVLLFL